MNNYLQCSHCHAYVVQCNINIGCFQILSIFPEWQEENFQWRDKSPLWVSENSFKHGVQKVDVPLILCCLLR